MINQNTILLVDTDGDCEELVARAAARSGHKVRWARTSREAFKFLNDELRELALIIVDIDPGAHGLSILEAVGACADCPGVVALTALEQNSAESVLKQHGATISVAKPITIENVAAAIQYVLKRYRPNCNHWDQLRPRFELPAT